MAFSTLCGLDVISALTERGEPLTVRQISDATGITRATTYRTLDDLLRAGWVVAEGTPQRFTPSWKVTGLGLQMLVSNNARDIAVRNTVDLAAKAGVTAFVSFLDGTETVFTDLVEVIGGRLMLSPVYKRLPAVLTASGRITLAHLPRQTAEEVVHASAPQIAAASSTAETVWREIGRAHTNGYGVSDYEVGEVISIAGTVRDASGCPRASMGLSLHRPTVRSELESRFGEVVREWARHASIELGHRVAQAVG